MAILDQANLTIESDLTYVTNVNNEISAADVRSLNVNWISSSVLIPMTSSMSVASAVNATSSSYALSASYSVSASYAANVPATASYALQALSSSYPVSASYAANVPATASYSLQALSSSYAVTASHLLNFPATSSYALQALSSSYAVSASHSLTSISSSRAVSSSYALTASFAQNAVIFPFTGSAVFSGSIVLTGSFSNAVSAVSISSNTASVDLSRSNFFTVTLPDAVNTFISVVNPKPGQTANIIVTTGINCSASFSSNVKQPSGSFYTPTADPATDVLSLVCVNTSNVLLVKSKMFI